MIASHHLARTVLGLVAGTTLTAAAHAAILSGSFAMHPGSGALPSIDIDLTSGGSTDWALFGQGNNNHVLPGGAAAQAAALLASARKDAGGDVPVGAISDLSLPTGGLVTLSGRWTGPDFQWTDGVSPNTAASNQRAFIGLRNQPLPSKLKFDVEVDAPGLYQVDVHVGGFRAVGQINAALSGAPGTLVDIRQYGPSVPTSEESGIYSIVFEATAANQTLSVDLSHLRPNSSERTFGVSAVTLSSFAGSPPSPALAAPTLVGHFPMDEGVDQVVNDMVGTNHLRLGTSSGAATSDPTWAAGKFGSALSFDGADDRAERVNATDAITNLPAGDAPRTLSMWVNARDALAGAFGGYGNNSNNQLFQTGFHFNNNGDLMAFMFGPGDLDTDTAITLDAWHHIAMTFDGANAVVYRDGQAINALPRTANTVLNFIRLGQQGTDGNNRFYNGLVDDMAIWDDALSANLIQTLFSLGNDLGLDAGQVNQLFNAYYTGNMVELLGLEWTFATGLDATNVGGVVQDGDGYRLAMDVAGNGLIARLPQQEPAAPAVPEPASAMLAMIGLLGLGVTRQCQRTDR